MCSRSTLSRSRACVRAPRLAQTHSGFQHDPISRGQPPLAFYVAAAGHAPYVSHGPGDETDGESSAINSVAGDVAGSIAGGITRYETVTLATSPDRSNPVVHALLARSNETALSSALRLPLTLSSTESFQADLSQLLCARHLVVARSSLNEMLLDSPNMRDIYTFQQIPEGCAAPPPCADAASASSASTAYHHARGGSVGWADPSKGVRSWCVAARKAAGPYSVYDKWFHSAAQVEEMLRYGMGQMSAPVLQKGPPLACAKK